MQSLATVSGEKLLVNKFAQLYFWTGREKKVYTQ